MLMFGVEEAAVGGMADGDGDGVGWGGTGSGAGRGGGGPGALPPLLLLHPHHPPL